LLIALWREGERLICSTCGRYIETHAEERPRLPLSMNYSLAGVPMQAPRGKVHALPACSASRDHDGEPKGPDA
jgi:hypothetical protein